MKKNNKGLALIMAIAIVGILAGIATTFAYNMRIDQKASANYLYFIKARYLAEAGIARAVAELQNDVASTSWLVSQVDGLYNSDLGEVWADGGDFSGSTNGTLGEGYFDLRYDRTIVGNGDKEYYTQLDETASDDVNGHVINGIVDEERKININYANKTLLLGLPGIGDAISNTIIAAQPNLNTIAEVMNLGGIGPNLLYGDDDGTDGSTTWTKVNNHKLNSTYENDGGTASVLDGGIEDLITVYNNALVITDSGNNTVPVNVNTAPETVLKAVIAYENIPNGNGIPDLTEAERNTVVQAILDYRSGAAGDGNPNPFDGIDQNRNDGIDPSVSGFTGDGLDNDSDGDDDNAEEAYMFAGGPRGEFNALITYIISTGYNGGGTISSADAANVMDNADPAADIDYDGDGAANNNVWTTSFTFNSKYFQIISTGVVQRGGVTLAEQKLMQIVGPIE